MEKQQKRGEEEKAALVVDMEKQQKRGEEATDRISQLPDHVLHHLLCFLPQKYAVQTCTLSKSWRYLGPTRTKLEICQRSLRGNKNKFLSVLANTLQRYLDQNLPIQEFILEMSTACSLDPDFEPISISFDEWIPKFLMNMGVKKFQLRAPDYAVPSVVFQAQSLEELSLFYRCKVDRINCSVELKMLKRLVLDDDVTIEDETFEKILSNCPLIQHLRVRFCKKLRTVKVNKALNLKHIDCIFSNYDDCIVSIDDAPSLETIHIDKSSLRCCRLNWYRLKSVCLFEVHLQTELLNKLSSSNFPLLEELELRDCYGFTEFKLSVRSIKSLILKMSASHPPIGIISIDAANMLHFELGLICGFVPSISFATSSECKSHIQIIRVSSETNADDFSSTTWFLELYEFLKAISQSQISLHISCFPHDLTNQGTCGVGGAPLVIEHLCLSAGHCSSSSALPALFNRLFRICRPRYVGASNLHASKLGMGQLAEKIWKALGKKRQYKIWKQGLQKTGIQVLDEKTKEWRPGQVSEFFSNQSIRFLLKWKRF